MLINDPKGWVGRSVKRKEDVRLMTGRGQYLADLVAPGAVHLAFLRSAHAAARIRSIDTSAARALPGVLDVVTGEDIRDKIMPMPLAVVQPNVQANFPKFWPLAVEEVRYQGEPVAVVVADSRYVAEDAAELIDIDYDPIQALVDPELALKADSRTVHPGWTTNEMFGQVFTGGLTEEGQRANAARVDEIIKNAPVVVRERFRIHRTGIMPLEPRGVLALWDVDDGLTVHATTQRPHIERLAIADSLGMQVDKVRVISPRDQGGGFGVKAPYYREPAIVAYMAIKLRRPVRWIETREEHLTNVSQERDQIHYLELAADKTGRILALRDDMIADNGDGCQGVYWGFIMPVVGAIRITSAYDLPDCHIHLRCVCTNKPALSPSRSFGSFPARFAMERAIDMIAHRVGIESAEVRLRNMVKSLPHTSATGVYMDSGDYIAVFKDLLAKVDLPAFRKKQAAALAEGRYIGVGFGLGVESSGVSSEELVLIENQPGCGSATVRIDPRGKIRVYQGDAPQGQGHETAIAQVVAQEFGIDIDDIEVVTGDTDTTPFTSGTIAARLGSYTISAIVQACRYLKTKMGTVFLHDLGLPAEGQEVLFASGRIFLRDDDSKTIGFAKLADRLIMRPLKLPEGVTAGLDHTAFFEAPTALMSFTAHAAFVEVDAKTGRFEITNYITAEDIGTVINPIIVEGQIQGGVIQGISNTMYEEFVYDAAGQQMSTTLEAYKLATAADVPDVIVTHDAATPCPGTPLGSRGVGEGVPGPVPGAVTNAVCDALRPFGIEIKELPLRPERIWRAIQAAGNGAAARKA
jgi:carbon-monoxide dehydrogenase large subunit